VRSLSPLTPNLGGTRLHPLLISDLEIAIIQCRDVPAMERLFKSATAYLNSPQERREGDDLRLVLIVVNAS